MNKRRIIRFIFLTTIFLSPFLATNSQVQVDTALTLTLYYYGGDVISSYAQYITQYLAEIGIKVEVKVQEWWSIIPDYPPDDYDLLLRGLTCEPDPDWSVLYSENGSLNAFNLNTAIPYGQENEDYLKNGIQIMDFEERQQHYYEWQELLMDKILPMVPLYSPRSYMSTWSNLQGYDNRWGVVDSLPYMEFDGLHIGQESVEEFIDHDAKWKELNPLLQDDQSSAYISDLCMEPLLKTTPGYEPLKTGLIIDWEQDETNECLWKFTMRDEVYWNPSYNITGRNSSSTALDTTSTPLMTGLKGKFSDGANQLVTAKDAIFTYLAFANEFISDNARDMEWMKRIWIDPLDELSFFIEVDGNPDTAENEGYAPFWHDLSHNLLPEFFLNSTSTTTMHTKGGIPHTGLYEGIQNTNQWKTFSTSAFGCGKYMIDHYIENSITVLKASPYWMEIGAIDGTEQDLDISRIVIRVIPDETAALTEFMAGKLDIMPLTLFPEERKSMQMPVDFKIQTKLQNYMVFLAFNLERPLVGGERNFEYCEQEGYEEYTKALALRKAIAYAIDREETNTVIHDGEHLICHSPIYPVQDYWYYNDIIKYNHNLDTALEWLERADVIKTTSVPFELSPLLMLPIISASYGAKRKVTQEGE